MTVQIYPSEATKQTAIPGDCRAQLERILSSTDFEATDREHRFLEHVVEEALSGRGERIKAYSIAVEVFGRDASFDPQTDPIVRIEAGHLRRSLERYYFTGGQSDPILITIPKGGYVPTFSPRPRPTGNEVVESASGSVMTSPLISIEPVVRPSVGERISWPTVFSLVATLAVLALILSGTADKPTTPEIPRLLVEPFEGLSGTEASTAVAIGMRQEVISQLAKFKDIVVVVAPAGTASLPRFVLAGSVALSTDAFRLRIRLTNQADGSVLWANSYEGGTKVAGLLEAQADIARNVATSLAQTYGVIFQADATLKIENPPDDWAAYTCTLSYYAYRETLDPIALPSVRDCLEKAVQRFPNYATAWGLLSQTYIDTLRFHFPLDPASSVALDKALATARRAVALDPLNIRGLQAEMFALYLSKQTDAAMAVGKQALETNPNDTELMGEYGYRLALSGKWDEGCPLVAEARERNPGPLAYYESALALCAYFRGDYPQAAMWIKKTSIPVNAIYHAIAAAIFSEAGYTDDAKRESAWLNTNAPAFVENLEQEVSFRMGRPQDVALFIGSLRKIGLDIRK